MKTQVILLENDDDYISVRDKMNWSQTRRILLVFPAAATNLIHPLDLTLIKRHAGSLGAQLAIVTMDPKIEYAAGQVGIPVFDNILMAQEGKWHVNPLGKIEPQINNPLRANKLLTLGYIKHKPSAGLSITRIIMFILAALALIALGIYIIPGANLRITPGITFRSLLLQLLTHSTETQLCFSRG